MSSTTSTHEQDVDEISEQGFDEDYYGALSGPDDGSDHNDDLLQRIESFAAPCHDQSQSALFGLLPAEIRNSIYQYAFAEYEDLSAIYDFDTCYRRPGYMAPRKTDTALLQTCQAIYQEAWYFPWNLAQHTFFLAWDGRKPTKTTSVQRMQRICSLIDRLCKDIPEDQRSIPHVQVFGQLCYIETSKLSPILNIEHFLPRTVTITIRHTDFWSWESDAPLQMGSGWVTRCRMPSSVTTVRMQIESLQRKKEQVEYMANRIKNEWYWQRRDGVHLVADSVGSETWTGSSVWEGYRWERDEDLNEPGRLHYNIATISFHAISPEDDVEGYQRRESFEFPSLDTPSEIYERTHITNNNPSTLVEANV